MTQCLPIVALLAICAATSSRAAGTAAEAAPVALPTALPAITGSASEPALGGTSGPVVSSTSTVPAIPLVAFERLIPFLPTPPKGWAADPAEGTTVDSDDLKLSNAQKGYHFGDADEPPTASVTIIDFAKNQPYQDGIIAAWQLKTETAEGFDRPVNINGLRGYEHYSKEVQGSSLAVIVAGRFFIQIELTKRDPKELRDWFKRIDIKKLAELR